MLLHRSIHRPFPSSDLPNSSSKLNTNNTLTPSESPMTEDGSQTIVPALLVNRASALSDRTNDGLHHFPSQTYIGPECTYPWSKPEPSATFGNSSFDCRMESLSSAVHSRTWFENAGDQAKGDDKWNLGAHPQLPTPLSSLSSSFNNNIFEPDQETIPSAQPRSSLRSPTLPIPSSHGQAVPWTDLTGNASEETRTRPRYNLQQSYAYDTAPSFGSSLYATSSNLQTPSQLKSHRPFRGPERLDPQDSEGEGEGKQGEPPYAKLIYRALMDSPGHKMVLKDIYEWIAQNTDKARDPNFKGWQNSVRHNLSMNGAFRKVPHVDPTNKAKKGFIWVLEPSAIEGGIESTTRYRQKTVSKRSENVDRADPKRQRSGRKGGRAAKKSAKLRRSALLELDARYPSYPKSELTMAFNALSDAHLRQVSPHQNWSDTSGLPYYLTPPLSSTQPSFPDNNVYDYGGLNENTDARHSTTMFDRQDRSLFGHPYNGGSAFMQHEGSGIIKFEDNYLANRLTALN